MSSNAVDAELRARAICDGAETDRQSGVQDHRRWVDSDTVAELLRVIDYLRGRGHEEA